MTAGQLISYLRAVVKDYDVSTAHAIELLNLAMDEISREIKLPQRTVTYESATSVADMVLPTDARSEGLIAVYGLSRNSSGVLYQATGPLPLLTSEDASAQDENWWFTDPSQDIQYVVYDPAQSGSYPRPVPPPDSSNPQNYRIVYAVEPTPMSALDDQPFDGQYDSFHILIAYKVAYMMTGNQIHLREYEKRMNALHAKTRPHGFLPRNMFMTAYTVGGGGRG